MADEKLINLQEFLDFGYLQEANRQFFHLVGLAIGIVDGDDGKLSHIVVYDFREDAEGVVYGEACDQEKGNRVVDEFRKRAAVRRELFGGTHNQPLDLVITANDIRAIKRKIAKGRIPGNGSNILLNK